MKLDDLVIEMAVPPDGARISNSEQMLRQLSDPRSLEPCGFQWNDPNAASKSVTPAWIASITVYAGQSEWVAVTESGYFASTNVGDGLMGWNLTNISGKQGDRPEFQNGVAYRTLFDKPERVRDAFSLLPAPGDSVARIFPPHATLVRLPRDDSGKDRWRATRVFGLVRNG